MSSHQRRSGKNGSGEYATFTAALKKVLSVSHSDISAEIKKRKRPKKASASPRA